MPIKVGEVEARLRYGTVMRRVRLAAGRCMSFAPAVG
jgi:hypothetical protein